MNIEEALAKQVPTIPKEVTTRMGRAKVTELAPGEVNRLVEEPELWSEMGVVSQGPHNFLVACTVDLPGVTPELLDWWLWWYPQDGKRYQAWLPGTHFDVAFDKKARGYFNAPAPQKYVPQPILYSATVGNIPMPVRVDYVDPARWGFDSSECAKAGIVRILCGPMGSFRGAIVHTRVLHLFVTTPSGLRVVTRYWLGEGLRFKPLRESLIREPIARALMEHAYLEFANLAEILPGLYKEYGN